MGATGKSGNEILEIILLILFSQYADFCTKKTKWFLLYLHRFRETKNPKYKKKKFLVGWMDGGLPFPANRIFQLANLRCRQGLCYIEFVCFTLLKFF